MKKTLLTITLIGMSVVSLFGKTEKIPTVTIKNSNNKSVQVEVIKKTLDQTTSTIQNVLYKKNIAIELDNKIIEVKVSINTEAPEDKTNYSIEIK